MIVIRARVRCKHTKSAQVRGLFEVVVAPRRAVKGVTRFDGANVSAFVATSAFN